MSETGNEKNALFKERLALSLKDVNNLSKLAKKAGVEYYTLMSYQRGEKPSDTKLSTATNLAKGLNISLDYLTGLIDEERPLYTPTPETESTPDKLLIDLLNIIKACNLKVENKPDLKTTKITVSNKAIWNFTRQAINASDERIKELAAICAKDLYFVKGKPISDEGLEMYRKNLFIYGHEIEEDDIQDFDSAVSALKEVMKYINEDNDDSVKEKSAEWEKTNGNPDAESKPEIYHLFFM